MFRTTSTPRCPWVVIDGNDKDVARKEAMRYVISQLDYLKKGSAVERITPDARIVEAIKNAQDAARYLSTHKKHG